MTELETLFFNDEDALKSDIENAIYEDDTTALANYRREFSFEHDFTARVSMPSIQRGTLTLDSREELDAVVRSAWSWDEDKYESEDEDTDYWSYECESDGVIAYGLRLLNPSLEAQVMLRKQAQDRKTEQTTRKVWNAIRSLVRATKGAENWSLAEEQQFVQEKTEELTKALVALN
jgi:hypothetical protein